MAAIPRLRDYDGPPVLSYGFRLFYLLGALYAGVSVLVWLPLLAGRLHAFGVFPPRDWHVHELLYGFLPAIVAGYLISAVPNWTGRFPVQGRPVVVLALAWVAGRIAVAFPAALGWEAVILADAAFLVLVIAAILREIIASRSSRNVNVAVALLALLGGNIVFHLEVQRIGTADLGWRLGVGTAIVLIMMVGGRIIPSFTRNWLARLRPGTLPAPTGTFDHAATAVGAAVLLYWAFAPFGTAPAFALAIAGVLQAVRLARWAGWRSAGNPLVFILHVAYAFVPVGFVLTGLAAVHAVSTSAGAHAWTAGAIGIMTLAVMTRTSLGLTGRPRIANAGTQIVYLLVVSGAVLRLWAALDPSASAATLHASGGLWSAAFLAFVIVYWRVLTGPRPDR